MLQLCSLSFLKKREREREEPGRQIRWLGYPPHFFSFFFFFFSFFSSRGTRRTVRGGGFFFSFFLWFYRYIEEMKPSQTLSWRNVDETSFPSLTFSFFPFLSTYLGRYLPPTKTFFWDPPTRILTMFTLLSINSNLGSSFLFFFIQFDSWRNLDFILPLLWIFVYVHTLLENFDSWENMDLSFWCFSSNFTYIKELSCIKNWVGDLNLW